MNPQPPPKDGRRSLIPLFLGEASFLLEPSLGARFKPGLSFLPLCKDAFLPKRLSATLVFKLSGPVAMHLPLEHSLNSGRWPPNPTQ